MANIPGAESAVPGVYSQVETIQRGVSVPVGVRTSVIMGEGEREEILVGTANGNGNDGFNPQFTSTDGSDGRHFLLGRGLEAVAPVVINRSSLFKNGVPLVISEDTIDDLPFDQRFDARLDPQTGQIELQAASLVDQGGEFFRPSAANVGDGYITNLELIDANAPQETWTIRCSSVQRDGYGNPIDGYARFFARGSESGVLLDGYGNQVIWTSDGTINDNGVLRFAINEGNTPFQEGDNFAIQTQGGALIAGDNLTARYISEVTLNEPEFFTDLNQLTAIYGQPTLTNRLSLGAQIAFANATPGVWALQCKPSVPRRVSYQLEDSANGQADLEDLTFELPLNVVPDVDSNINFFVTDPVTRAETQITPNKVAFYDPTITSNPASFVFGPDAFSYTVILQDSVQKSGEDGVLTVTSPTQAALDSATVNFGLEDVTATRSVQIENSNFGNDGIYAVVGVLEGKLIIERPSGFANETEVEFKVLDSKATSARILFTQDLALTLGEALRCTVVDTKDADFFDAGWIEAYEAAEKIETDMVVPLPSQTISAIFQNGKLHVESMSNIRNKKERMLFVGAIQGLTPENVTGQQLAAVENIGVLEGIQGDEVDEILAGNVEDLADYGVQNAFGDSFRVVYFYPDQIVVQTGADNNFADGFFMAAAAAGYFSGNSKINEPLTNKRLSGFTILRDRTYAPLVQENIVNNGITLLVPVQGGGRVIWGKTTTDSLEAVEEEISIIFIRDRIAKSMRRGLQPYIGKAESNTTRASLIQTSQALLQTFLQQQLITTFDGLTVERDPVEPRQWNITVAVQPVFPINWIFLRIAVGRLD